MELRTQVVAHFLLPIPHDDVNIARRHHLQGVLHYVLHNGLVAQFLEHQRLAFGGGGVLSCRQNRGLQIACRYHLVSFAIARSFRTASR